MVTSIAVKPKKKRGRPATGKDPLLGVRVPPETTLRIDALAADEGITRSEAVRRLIELGLHQPR